MYKEVPVIARKGFIKGLWRSITSIYNEITVHPFLQDLTDGTLYFPSDVVNTGTVFRCGPRRS